MARKTKHLILWVADEHHAAFQKLAKSRGKTMAQTLRALINYALKSDPETKAFWDAAVIEARSLSDERG